MHFADILEGEEVEFSGWPSGKVTGNISGTDDIYDGFYASTLDDQVIVDVDAQNGDSGSPVYSKTWDNANNRWNADAYGILWGGDNLINHEYYFSTMDEVESDLGLTIIVEIYP